MILPMIHTKPRSTRAGFTFFEMMLVMGLLLIFTAISIPLYRNYQVNSDLQTAVQQLVHALHRARNLARSGDGGSTWGVHVTSTTGITLFKGASFESRDQTEDEEYALVSSIQVISTLSPPNEVIFAQVTGGPSSLGEIILTQSHSGKAAKIIINQWNTTLD